jgi:hypothetical protein
MSGLLRPRGYERAVVHRSFPLGATGRGRAVRRQVVVGRLAATESALHHSDDQNDGPDSSGVAVVADPSADVAGRLASQEDVRRLREVADELTADQRLVLACQVAPDIDGRDFSHRTTPLGKGPPWAHSTVARARRAARSPTSGTRRGRAPAIR